ncbi:MAG: hypothetical protein ACO1N6_11975 [Microcella sp.]
MMSPARRAVALVAAAALVAGLAACAPAEPEAQPEPTVTPTPTETVAGPTPPGSRVPATCEQLFAGLAGFTGGPAENVEVEDLATRASMDQSGFEYCKVAGSIGGTAVEIATVIGVEIDESVIRQSLGFAEEYGWATGVGGELSYSQCLPVQAYSYCVSEVFANGYLLQFSTMPSGSVAADFEQSFRALAADLADRALAWPAPVAAWVAPEGALAWATDCDTDVASTDAAIRAAMPFEVAPATFIGSGDGFFAFSEAARRQRVTACTWSTSEAPYGSVTIQIAPGAAWLLDGGTPLPGTPIDYPGAAAASVVDWPSASEPTQSWLWVVVDGSIVFVEVNFGGRDFDRQASIDASLRVVDAIVATFGAGS